MAALSTQAEVGKILIIVDIILGAFGVLAVMAFGAFLKFFMPLNFLYGLVGTWAVAAMAGLVLAYFAFREAERKDYHTAGIYALIASFLPPVRLITLAGAILCLLSPEADKGATGRTRRRKR